MTEKKTKDRRISFIEKNKNKNDPRKCLTEKKEKDPRNGLTEKKENGSK